MDELIAEILSDELLSDEFMDELSLAALIRKSLAFEPSAVMLSIFVLPLADDMLRSVSAILVSILFISVSGACE